MGILDHSRQAILALSERQMWYYILQHNNLIMINVQCSLYTMVYRWIQRSVGIKWLQEFVKSDHRLRRYCILSGGVFYFEPPCRKEQKCSP